ncbi:MAG: hypothetical protein JXN59_13260, partial [Anaerolineae bacterium]|nr:hypothetical protein [Anaerolineae bacterium]
SELCDQGLFITGHESSCLGAFRLLATAVIVQHFHPPGRTSVVSAGPVFWRAEYLHYNQR